MKNSKIMENKTFLGIGWNFPPELGRDSSSTVMSSDEENIRQSLQILLGTSPGERVNRYDYGCPIQKYVFEILDVTTQTLLAEEIKKSVILFEPRIDLDTVTFEVHQAKGELLIKLEYTIHQTNRRSSMVYPFYLNEGTDITQ